MADNFNNIFSFRMIPQGTTRNVFWQLLVLKIVMQAMFFIPSSSLHHQTVLLT